MKKVEQLTKEILEIEYKDNQRSTTDIANEYGTNPKRISRLLKKFEIKTRSRSEAQKLVVKDIHPTRGKQRSDEEKQAISKGGAKSWTKDRKEQASKLGKELWDKKSPEEIKRMREKATQALLQTSKEGSKLEKDVIEILSKHDIPVVHHQMPIKDQSLEVDLWLTSKDVVIEIDGIRHVRPIHGEEDLKRRMEADKRKNDLLTAAGYGVIRFVVIKKNISQNDLFNIEEILMKLISKVKKGKVLTYEYGE